MTIISATQVLFAIGATFLAGFAALRLLASRAEAGPLLERIGLWWLLGAGWVSLVIAALGTVLNGAFLVAGVLGSIATLLFAGQRKPSGDEIPEAKLSPWEIALLCVLAAEFFAISVFAFRIALGWDALMTWEWKARLAFLNGGSLPGWYFSNVTYGWSLPRYPLELPYIESWLYLCLGRFDQGWVRVIGPFYYVAAAFVVAGACQRIHGSRLLGVCAAAALFFVPYFFSGTWGIFAGYADIPLGALLVAAMSRIPSLGTNAGAGQARLFGFLAALLPWMKREGLQLWVVVMLLVVVQIWRIKNWRLLPWIVLPGLLLIAAFESAMTLLDALPYHGAVALSFDRFSEHRFGFVSSRLIAETLDFESWSFLWPGSLAAVIALFLQRRTHLAITFGGGLILCWLLLGAVYLVGYPNDLEAMISITIDRIVLQFAPLAVLTIALGVSPLPSKIENKVLPVTRNRVS